MQGKYPCDTSIPSAGADCGTLVTVSRCGSMQFLYFGLHFYHFTARVRQLLPVKLVTAGI